MADRDVINRASDITNALKPSASGAAEASFTFLQVSTQSWNLTGDQPASEPSLSTASKKKADTVLSLKDIFTEQVSL